MDLTPKSPKSTYSAQEKWNRGHMAVVCTKLMKQDARRLDRACQRGHITRSALLRALLQDYLKEDMVRIRNGNPPRISYQDLKRRGWKISRA